MNERSGQHGLFSGRLTGIDVLRIVATLLVVALHAGMPYLPEMMPGLAWTVEGISVSEENPVVTWFVWSIECFIMPLFFVISGVSTRIMLDRKGGSLLFKNRRDRLLKPFLIFGIPILIAEFYLWNLGYVFREEISWKQYLEFDVHDYDSRLWGIAHFWYLQYLLLYTILLVLSCRFRGSSKPGTERWFSWGGKRQYLSLVGVTFLWAIGFLSFYPEIVADFDHGYTPIAKRIFYFGIYFAAGVSLVSSVRRAPEFARKLAFGLVFLAGVAITFAIPLIRTFLSESLTPPDWGAGAILTIVAIGLSIGLSTLFLFWNPELPPWLRYMGASAYWVYFIHHLLCGAIHLALDDVGVSIGTKFLTTFLGAMLGSLLIYQVLIRNRWPEVVFNGRKSGRLQREIPELKAEIEPEMT
ncbi:MAG: acyltransferase [Planctomycetaceae bacterium]|nr:acyltransferase [Planctomycetaceae bacterium]